jgi:hypothetical protein
MHRITRGRAVATIASLALLASGLAATPASAVPAVQLPAVQITAPQRVENDFGGISFNPGSVLVVFGDRTLVSCTIQPKPLYPPDPCAGASGTG